MPWHGRQVSLSLFLLTLAANAVCGGMQIACGDERFCEMIVYWEEGKKKSLPLGQSANLQRNVCFRENDRTASTDCCNDTLPTTCLS